MTAWVVPGVSPLALAAVIAAAVAAAYFFRARSRVMEVPAVTVWLRVGRPVHTRSVGTILAAVASLATQLLIVGLLLWTMREPFPRAPGARRVAVVLDCSATMQTVENGRSRFDLATVRARDLLAALPKDAEVTLLTAAATPGTAGPLSPTMAVETIAKLKPTDTDGDLPAAERAASFLAGDPAARAVVLSDFAAGDAAAVRAAWNGPAALDLSPVGTDQPDAAVVDVWQRPRDGDPAGGGQTIGVRVASRGMSGRSAAAVLTAGGAEVARQSVPLSAEATTCEFAVSLPAGTPYEVRIESGDALACDDSAYGVVRDDSRLIALVSDGNAPLAAGLRAGGRATVRTVRPEAFDGPRPGETVVIDQTAQGRLPPQWRGRLAGDGGLLLVGTADPFAPGEPAGVDRPKPTHWAGTHPVLAGVVPDLIRFDWAVATAPGMTLWPILSAGDVPLIGESVDPPDGNGPRTVCWLFRLADTDLPDRVAFPVLLWNTLDYLHGDDPQAGPAMTGRNVAASVRKATRATGPDGATAVRVNAMGAATFDASRAGVYGFDDVAGTKVGVSYLSRRPLVLLPKDIAAASRDVPAAIATPGTWRRPSWEALAVVLLVLMLTELVLYRRGVLRVGT